MARNLAELMSEKLSEKMKLTPVTKPVSSVVDWVNKGSGETYDDYIDWCAASNCEAEDVSTFEQEILDLAKRGYVELSYDTDETEASASPDTDEQDTLSYADDEPVDDEPVDDEHVEDNDFKNLVATIKDMRM